MLHAAALQFEHLCNTLLHDPEEGHPSGQVCCRWEDSEDLAVTANNFMRSGLQAAYKLPMVKKVR